MRKAEVFAHVGSTPGAGRTTDAAGGVPLVGEAAGIALDLGELVSVLAVWLVIITVVTWSAQLRLSDVSEHISRDSLP